MMQMREGRQLFQHLLAGIKELCAAELHSREMAAQVKPLA